MNQMRRRGKSLRNKATVHIKVRNTIFFFFFFENQEYILSYAHYLYAYIFTAWPYGDSLSRQRSMISDTDSRNAASLVPGSTASDAS